MAEEAPATAAQPWPLWATASCAALLTVLLTLHCADRLAKSDAPAHKAAVATKHSAAFARFQRQYLGVFFLVMFADWLQGTHMYSLYQSYGVSVSALFLTGFLSSAVFGNWLGAIVDRYGRRNACLVYCALEIVINLLENVPNMPLLLVGRVLGGISTSLLFSAFESWMVTEHRARGFAEELIPKTFAIASEGNGVLAVLAGFVSQAAADAFGDIGPFQVAVATTVLAAVFVYSWTENYGVMPPAAPAASVDSVAKPGSPRLSADAIALGMCYSLFDGAMYVFVFLWYPTLEAVVPDGNLPSGLVYSSFMLSMAIGGKLFDQVSGSVREELLVCVLCAVSVAAMLVPMLTSSYLWTIGAFFTFEVVIGAFSPCCATLRSRYFPAEGLSSTLGHFRLPTNILVVLGTGGTNHLSTDQLFASCSAVLALSTVCGARLLQASLTSAKKKKNV